MVLLKGFIDGVYGCLSWRPLTAPHKQGMLLVGRRCWICTVFCKLIYFYIQYSANEVSYSCWGCFCLGFGLTGLENKWGMLHQECPVINIISFSVILISFPCLTTRPWNSMSCTLHIQHFIIKGYIVANYAKPRGKKGKWPEEQGPAKSAIIDRRCTINLSPVYISSFSVALCFGFCPVQSFAETTCCLILYWRNKLCINLSAGK